MHSVIFWLNLSLLGGHSFKTSIAFLSTPFSFPACRVPSLFLWNPDLCWLCYVFVLFLPQWGRKAGGGWSREEFPYSSWNQVSEFSPAKSLPLESKPLLWRRFRTIFPHAYSSAPAGPMRGSFLYPRYGNLVEFVERRPVKVCPPPPTRQQPSGVSRSCWSHSTTSDSSRLPVMCSCLFMAPAASVLAKWTLVDRVL